MQRVYERSDGNPLFVIELVRELREGSGERVPASIGEIVRERLGRLDDTARTTLQTAAVAGASPSVELLVNVTGMREGDILQQLHKLVTSHFLRQGVAGELCFVHDVIRQAVYEGIPAEAARATHARVGFALQSLYADRFSEVAASAAWHFENGGIAAAAVDASLVAAESALKMYALDEAAAHAGKAYDGGQTPPIRFRALRILEFVAGLRADRQEQRNRLDALLAASKVLGPDERAQALLRKIDFSADESADAQRTALQALREHIAAVPRYEARYLLREGEYFARTGEVRAAKTALASALEQLSGEPDVEAIVRCLTTLYTVALECGDPLEECKRACKPYARISSRAPTRGLVQDWPSCMRAHCSTAIRQPPSRPRPVCSNMRSVQTTFWLEALAHRSLGASAARQMLIGPAQRHLRRSAEITVMAGRLRDLARVRVWQLLVENRSADFTAARSFGELGIEAAQRCGAVDLLCSCLSNLANTAVWSGDIDGAERNLRESLRVGGERGYAQPSTLSLLGEVTIRQGKIAEGIALIENARNASSPQDVALGVTRVHHPLLLGLVYLAQGREADARRHAEIVRGELAAYRSYYVHPQMYLWSASQLLAMLGYDEDASAFAQAARGRREEILHTIEDEGSRRAFRAFVFNRLIETDAHACGPLQAWYVPQALNREVTAV